MQWVFFYPIVGEGVISFPENTKIDRELQRVFEGDTGG